MVDRTPKRTCRCLPNHKENKLHHNDRKIKAYDIVFSLHSYSVFIHKSLKPITEPIMTSCLGSYLFKLEIVKLMCRSVWSVNLFYCGTIIEFLLLIADSHVDHADDPQLDTRILVQTYVYFDKNKVITNNLLLAHKTAQVVGLTLAQRYINVCPANTRHFPNVVLMLARRLRHRPSIKTTLVKCLVFAVRLVVDSKYSIMYLCWWQRRYITLMYQPGTYIVNCHIFASWWETVYVFL